MEARFVLIIGTAPPATQSSPEETYSRRRVIAGSHRAVRQISRSLVRRAVIAEIAHAVFPVGRMFPRLAADARPFALPPTR